MKLKIGFNAEPSIYCYMEYKLHGEADTEYKPLFSNVTNTGAGLTPSVTANASLSGNTLTLTTEFEQLGASFDFRIYNYNNFKLKATCAGFVKYSSKKTSAENAATDASPIVFTNITTGGAEIVFEFEGYVPPSTPYTIGTYGVDTILGEDTEVTDTIYNGYKYIKFNGIETWTNSENITVPLRWVIIGAGENYKRLLPEGAANKNANPDNLGADELLVISEQCIEHTMYDENYANWSTSDIRDRMKSYTEEGGFMASVKQYMVPQALKTAWHNGSNFTTNSTTKEDPDYMFLLAYNWTYDPQYATQNFLMENYLENEDGDLYKEIYEGCDHYVNGWWLRSGGMDDGEGDYGGGRCATSIYELGGVNEYEYVAYDNYAIRPCFVLNFE